MQHNNKHFSLHHHGIDEEPWNRVNKFFDQLGKITQCKTKDKPETQSSSINR